MTMVCERCAKDGVADRGVERVLTIVDVVDEQPDGTLQLSNHDAFTVGLCLACASDVQRMVQRLVDGE
jgi:hypothetical protein